MELIADILLVAGALGAGLYCFVLSRRLKRFADLEKGVGGAVAVLSSQANELKQSLNAAREASDQSGVALKDLTNRAESVAQRLELMMASMHDVITEETAPDEPVRDEETAPPDEIIQEESEPKQAVKPESTQSAKRPAGLMFMRHGRKSDEAAA